MREVKTNVLLEMFGFLKTQPLHIWLSSPWSDKLVLRSTNRQSRGLQVVMANVGQNWNRLVQCLMKVWKVVFQFPASVLPDTVLYERGSGGLLKKSEMIGM